MISKSGKSESFFSTPAYAACAVLILAHLVLMRFAQSIPWHAPLFAFFFATSTILPGYVITGIFFYMRKKAIRMLFSFVTGIALFFAVLVVFSIFSWDLVYIGIVIPAVTLLLMFSAVTRFIPPKRAEIDRDLPPGGAAAVVLLAVLIALVSYLVLQRGDPLIYSGDSLDHLGYIRSVSRTHQAFPDGFLYKDGGILTRDIRKGLIHQMWGTLNILTGRRDPLPVWPLISLSGSIFILLSLYSAGLVLFRSSAVGFLSALFFVLFYHSGLRDLQLITIAYGFPYGKIFSVSFLTTSLVWLVRGERPFLVLAGFSAIAAAGTHIGHFLVCCFLMLAFTLIGPLAAPKGSRMKIFLMRGPLLGAVTIGANLPYLLLRYIRDYAPGNILHTEPQGLLTIYGPLKVLNPVVFFQSAGPLCIISILSIFILWKKSSGDRYLSLLLWGTIAILLLSFNPLWVPVLMEKISYLLIRMEFAVPSVIIAAILARELWLKLLGEERMISKGAAAAGWITILSVFGHALVMTPAQFAYSGKEPSGARGTAPLYSAINTLVPEGSVIASDPVTSYSIAAFTDQYVVCTLDQHSVPNDTTALERILAMRDVFQRSPDAAPIARVLKKYGARFVALNGRIPRDVHPMYWKPGEDDFLRMSRLLETTPGCRIIFGDSLIALYDCGGVYAGGEDLSPKPDAGHYSEGESPSSGDRLIPSGEENISFREVRASKERVQRGDTIALEVEWVATGPVAPRSYTAYLRFNTSFPKGKLYRGWYGKIYRKITELSSGSKYRFRHEFVPFNGLFPPDKWPEGRIVGETIRLRVPASLSPGEYSVALRMSHSVPYPNYYLWDIFTDEDAYQGYEAVRVRIE